MQQCSNCASSFTWKSIYRYMLGHLFTPLSCSHCGQEHTITIRGRFINSILTICPALLFMLFLSPFHSMFATLGIGLSLIFAGTLLTPFMVTFKKAEESVADK
ncbi:TIGR04104 family putative zinc finger protein [Bacillus sp. KH172YL63]|uniref:TIGR04104 family putative zinc finger protein n=1 Tax=Bacillus sp. KH172YL63 TaxID=2709784 RepID=UPI00156505E2|nr:TIGR04104 family putative zinc finger protein [Bacillus sp. KH172YL63]